MIPAVTQPGPIAETRRDIVPANGRPIEVNLRPHIPLADAIAEALDAENCTGAWLEIKSADVARLSYVTPALAPDSEHAAWWSEIYRFNGAGTIHHLGMMVGRDQGACFLHGHGRWSPATGGIAMGHILAQQTVLSRPAVAHGIGLRKAYFDRRPDPETNFNLFQPTGDALAASDAPYALLRLAPNQEFSSALDLVCAELGWQSAKIFGQGSLIGAHFDDGSTLDSLATEFLILNAEARADGSLASGPEIAIVGIDPDDLRRGVLQRGKNPILITAELLLQRQ
jgi:hypothetical protein